MITDIEKAYFDAVTDSINMLVPWYLLAAYAYYEQDDPIISDSIFDTCAKKLLENWDSVTHMHKDCITKGDLEAGTFLGKYPSRIEGALSQLRNAYGVKRQRH